MSATSSSKETLTVIRNLKEARVLEKSLQTLSLEESYAAKLLDLDAKMVRFKFGRLKKNINKIKTHLQAEDISNMRQLEREGRFVPEHPMICTSSSSTKIAAAEKRLKLSRSRRVQSAMPALGARSRTSTSCSTSNDSSSVNTYESKSSRAEKSKPQCKHRIRPKTTNVCFSGSKTSDDESETPRAIQNRERSAKTPSTTALLLEKISKAQKEVKESAPAGVYSSHEERAAEDDGLSRVEAEDPSFGTNQYEERRKRLIGAESETFNSLRDKKLEFVEHVEDMKRTNVPLVKVEPEWTQTVIKSIDSMASRSDLTASKMDKHIDLRLVKKVLYTPNKFEREYHTIQLMRKGKNVPETIDDLFVPLQYKDEEVPTN